MFPDDAAAAPFTGVWASDKDDLQDLIEMGVGTELHPEIEAKAQHASDVDASGA